MTLGRTILVFALLAATVTTAFARGSASAVAGDALTVRDVQVVPIPTGRRLVIDLTTPPTSIRSFQLHAPPRLVIDAIGPVPTGAPSRQFAVTDGAVQRVHVGTHDGFVRTVAELARGGQAAEVHQDGSLLIAEIVDPQPATEVLTSPVVGELVGKRLKITGRWTGERIEILRVQYRDATKEARRGRVTGTIATVDHDQKTLRIGPFEIVWHEDSRFEDLGVGDLVPGAAVDVTGIVEASGRLAAESLTAGDVHGDRIEVVGAVTADVEHDDGSRELHILGAPTLLPAGVSTREANLARNLDDPRPDEQLTVSVFGRPLVIGGEIGVETRSLHDLELGSGKDRVRLDAELQLELLYRLAPHALLFLESKGLLKRDYRTGGGSGKHTTAIGRGETWLYLSDIRGSGVSLQLGRQNVRESRQWWWNRDLDAVRVSYDRPNLHGELGVARELGRVTTDLDRIDPEDEDVLRIFASAGWLWTSRQRLDGFALFQRDDSPTPAVGSTVPADREDKHDANLLWVGFRQSGVVEHDALGELRYWLDGALVTGHEVLLSFDDAEDDRLVVKTRTSHDVWGGGFDGGFVWKTPLPRRFSLMAGYAVGSRRFVQTGLHRNRDRLGGIDRFRYYGELLRPELANLHIGTIGAGIYLHPTTSLQLLYHLYHQVDATDSLRDTTLDTDPTGGGGFIGHEWDLVLSFEESRHWELQVIGALFRAGSAFGDDAGHVAGGTFVKLNYNF